MSAYNFDEDLLFLKYMEEGIIDSSIDKPVTINRLCQRVRDELENYQVNSWNKDGHRKNNKISNCQMLCANCHSIKTRRNDKPAFNLFRW